MIMEWDRVCYRMIVNARKRFYVEGGVVYPEWGLSIPQVYAKARERSERASVNREIPQRCTKKVKTLTIEKNKNKGVAKNKTIYNIKANC